MGGLLGTSRSALETQLDLLSTNKDSFTREFQKWMEFVFERCAAWRRIGGGTEVDPAVDRHAFFFFHHCAGASPDCRVHYSSRVGVLQLSQGSKLGLGRGYERAPSGGELVLWCVLVFDRAAVIAPRRPRRVSTIKTSTSERDSLPKERRARREEGDLRRARQEKAFIHFV